MNFPRTAMDRERLAALNVDPESIADDHRDYTGLLIEKPWGHEMQIRKTAEFAITRLEILGGAETSMHCHPHKTVILMVDRSAVLFCTLLAEYAFRQGDVALVEKGVFHRLRAEADGAAVLEIEWPPNKRDLVRLDDKHGRAGQPYETP